MNKCNQCGETTMGDNLICEDCRFENMMDREDKDMDIFDNQDGICPLCGNKLDHWTVRDGKAICYPSCPKT